MSVSGKAILKRGRTDIRAIAQRASFYIKRPIWTMPSFLYDEHDLPK